MFFCDARCAKDHAGDLTIARAIDAPIDGLQHVSCAAVLQVRETRVPGHSATQQSLDESKRGLDPVEGVCVEGNECGKRLMDVNAGETQEMQCATGGQSVAEKCAGIVGEGFGGSEQRKEIAIEWQDRWDGCEHDSAGVGLGRPDDRCLRGVERGLDGEIATPIAGEEALKALGGLLRSAGASGNPAGNRRCGEAIPRRDPGQQDHRHSRMSMRIAIVMYPGASVPS